MTQRIFDVDNPQDVKDLFDILPDDVDKIQREIGNSARFLNKKGMILYISELVAFNWRDKKEIIRPVDKSEWIGCLCRFADVAGDEYIGVLHAIRNSDDSYPFVCKNEILRSFKHCRPVRRVEIKFVEDAE